MEELDRIVDKTENTKVTVTVIYDGEYKMFDIDTKRSPYQASWIGKGIGDKVYTRKGEECVIEKIVADEIEVIETEEELETDISIIDSDRKMIADLFSGRIIGRNITCEYESMKFGLHYLHIHGRVAREIYDNLCGYYKFNKSKAYNFDRRQLLFSENCSPEGYAVWMLPHSNLNGETNGIWANFADIQNNEIVQFTFGANVELSSNKKRLTYVKQKNGEYVFLGIYKLKEQIIFPYKNDREPRVKEIFELVSEDYPEKK